MDKIWTEMRDAALAVFNARQISDYASCGEVSAAVLSASGKIYTGVCVDTCSGLGVCARSVTLIAIISFSLPFIKTSEIKHNYIL